MDPPVRDRVLAKLRWLSEYADRVVHHALTSMPDDLKGLCRLRVGDWRLLYWIYHDSERIVVYRIAHRREAYEGLS